MLLYRYMYIFKFDIATCLTAAAAVSLLSCIETADYESTFTSVSLEFISLIVWDSRGCFMVYHVHIQAAVTYCCCRLRPEMECPKSM